MTYHEPVMLMESVDGLDIKSRGTYIDTTFGGGGHSREILKRLKKGQLIAFDQDKDAEKNIIDDKRFRFVRQNFKFMGNYLKYFGITEVDGILADLGVSSHQLDTPERGFSFRFDSKLDSRMNQSSTLTASEIINEYPEDKLYEMFRFHGDIPNASKLARTIVKAREQSAIHSTKALVAQIASCYQKHKENKYLAKVFQALRIEANQEKENLETLLVQSARYLKKGGRLVVISYHSMEDRLVKNYFRKGVFGGEPEKDLFGNYEAPFKPVNKNVIIPGEEEINTNNRARSAKLRIAEKI